MDRDSDDFFFFFLELYMVFYVFNTFHVKATAIASVR